MAKRKGKNTLIDNIASLTDNEQESNVINAISSNNEQINVKSEYESLTEDLTKNPELDINDATEDISLTETVVDNSMQLYANLNDKLINFKSTISELSSANLKLASENSSLQEENDRYLMKISELTFENAKLNAQIQELSKSANHCNNNPLKFNETTIPNTIESSNKKTDIQSAKNVNYPYQLNNGGYSSWN